MVKNHCKYLSVGQKDVCGKNCMGEYCAEHNRRLKQYESPPKPCIVCGVGTFRSVQICTLCTPGGRYSNERYEAKIRKIAYLANQDYDIVRNNLVKCV